MGEFASVLVQGVAVRLLDNLGFEFVQVGVHLGGRLASVEAVTNGRKRAVESLGVLV
jgi:hypothetical protein